MSSRDPLSVSPRGEDGKSKREGTGKGTKYQIVKLPKEIEL